MAKFKTNNEVVNRGGKKFFAKDGVIEVTGEDVKILEDAGFTQIKENNENTKKGNKKVWK